MPKFGYGPIGGRVRSFLSGGAAKAAGLQGIAEGAFASSPTWGNALKHDAMRYAAKGLGGLSQMSNAGLGAIAGGIAGASYGAFSDNTSVLGGAVKGALGGAGLVGAARLGSVGMGAFGRARRRGLGVGASAYRGLSAMGRFSKNTIGNTLSKAYNPIKSAMKTSPAPSPLSYGGMLGGRTSLQNSSRGFNPAIQSRIASKNLERQILTTAPPTPAPEPLRYSSILGYRMNRGVGMNRSRELNLDIDERDLQRRILTEGRAEPKTFTGKTGRGQGRGRFWEHDAARWAYPG